MSENNQSLAPLTAKGLFARDDVKHKFQEMLGKRAPQFITSVLQIVASNDLLAKADPLSIYQSAAVAATLDLPLNNNLGFAYIVPYNQSYKEGDQWKKRAVAQFQMGYKGFIQLGQRSGQFLTINATDVHEGEIKTHDRLSGMIDFEWQQDVAKRDTLPVIGYAAYFKLLNGFEKTLYMTVAELKKHGLKYSQTFQREKGLWKDDFNAMATKTVLKLLLSKYAPMSVEMQKAVVTDQAIINDADTMDVTYVDNSPVDSEITYEELFALSQKVESSLTAKEFEDVKRILGNKEETSYAKIHSLLLAKVSEDGHE